MYLCRFLGAFLGAMLICSVGFAAEEAAVIDSGDTAWVLASAALVFFMTPGLAFFYGGMVRSKNVLSTMMQSFFIIALISVQWILIGYTLAFGTSGGLIGGLDKMGLAGVSNSVVDTVPEYAFVAFQCMFAVITPALITGAFAERIRFAPLTLFILLWALLIYNPMAHWVWGGGWIEELGALDFAGGLVIHILSGVSGLVAALMIGKRKGYGETPILPHNLPYTILGASMLWFGWFGFNAGSALGANELAANAFITTQAATAAGVLGWSFMEWIRQGKPTALGAVSGAIAGLVAITPAAGFVAPVPAIWIGLIGGLVCYFAVAVIKGKLGYDDSLDAFGIHGFGGIWGAIATGLWATLEVNADGANGLFYGGSDLLMAQLISVAFTVVFAAVGTVVLLSIVKWVMKIRPTDSEEVIGLDITEHGERAYN
jgi:ammonium transporter